MTEQTQATETRRPGKIMLHVHDGECRYPVETQGRTHFFCGKPTKGREAYCPKHRATVYMRDPR